MTTATKSKKLSKADMAAMLADAMNLLNHVRALTEDGCFDMREDNAFHSLAARLPETIRGDFWNNATLSARDLL